MIPWEEADDGFLYFMSIDGTHCPINEPRPFSKKNSSYKLGGSAGVNYEIGLQINRNRLLWIYGPTKPGETNDLGVFHRSLKGKFQAFRQTKGERLIVADGIYAPETDLIATSNNFDPPELAKFKDRVSARHEFFNHYVKEYNIFKTKFHHKDDTKHTFHGRCFRAACAVIMFELDNESIHLFDPYPV